jgi:hypothetical protein
MRASAYYSCDITTEDKAMNVTLTTDHPASSHNLPVALIDGQAYGPDDMVDGLRVGGVVATNICPSTPAETIALARQFISQSPEHGERWAGYIDGQLHGEQSEFPDER